MQVTTTAEAHGHGHGGHSHGPVHESIKRSRDGLRAVRLAVIASALALALGIQIADPLIGLGITLVILKITRDSWVTVRAARAGSAAA